MLPSKSDPKWLRFIDDLAGIQVESLPARMFLNRLTLKLQANASADAKSEAIGEAFEFFTKNQCAIAEDIQRIFG
jgi:hypothetical protein